MLLTILTIATVILSLAAAAFTWRDSANSKDRRRRRVLAICAACFCRGGNHGNLHCRFALNSVPIPRIRDSNADTTPGVNPEQTEMKIFVI
jgi:hypothetical protein